MSEELQKPHSHGPTLLRLISEQKLQPKDLTVRQRRICIRFLLHERKHTTNEISSILQVNQSTVWRHKNVILYEDSFILNEMDEAKEAVNIIKTAEVASMRLFRKGDEKAAWDVQKQAVEVLQSLGYLRRSPVEFKGQLTIQEILKLANSPDQGDETLPSEGTGRGGKNFITNGAS